MASNARSRSRSPRGNDAESVRPSKNTFSIDVVGLNGHLCTLLAESSWQVSDVKVAIHADIGISPHEQRLTVGASILEDADALHTVCHGMKCAQVTLVRRDPEIAEWLQRIARQQSLVCPLTTSRAVRVGGIGQMRAFQHIETLQQFQNASVHIRSDREVALAMVGLCGFAANALPKDLRADREIMRKAMGSCGLVLESASEEIRRDRECVLAAVKEDARALRFVSSEFKADPEIIELAVDQRFLMDTGRRESALSHASAELRSNRDLVLKAVQNDKHALSWASHELKADREVVLAAVRNSAFALRHAVSALQQDEEILAAATGSEERTLPRGFATYVTPDNQVAP